MTYTDEVDSVADPLRRAKVADEKLWAAASGRIRLRNARDEAVRDALRAGTSIATVATTLSVRDDDVRRMAQQAIERAAGQAPA